MQSTYTNDGGVALATCASAVLVSDIVVEELL